MLTFLVRQTRLTENMQWQAKYMADEHILPHYNWENTN